MCCSLDVVAFEPASFSSHGIAYSMKNYKQLYFILTQC